MIYEALGPVVLNERDVSIPIEFRLVSILPLIFFNLMICFHLFYCHTFSFNHNAFREIQVVN